MSYTDQNTETVTCPKCAEKATRTYSPPYQEYAGAGIQGGYYFTECACGYEGIDNADLSNYNVQENTRGW
jgi:hypothetical protein